MSETVEWEVVDDDGFIYKRRKKLAGHPSTAAVVQRRDPVLSDQAELRVREAMARRKKMATLLAQKEMYATEVGDWEILLSEHEALAYAPVPESAELDHVSLQSIEDATSKDDLQILHVQVGAYEGFIKHLQRLHDRGEQICKQLEEDVEKDRISVEQDLLKDVVKLTPRNIISALTSEAASRSTVTNLPVKTLLGRMMAEYR